MNVSDLFQLPEDARKILQSEGITQLNPPQEMAVNRGLLDGKSLIVSAPTASGKTFIAELAILNTVLNKRKKAIYIVPLKALGSEKYTEFRERYFPLGIKTGLSMGDYDSSDTWLASQDIIIATSEKLDSLMRHQIPWIDEVGLVVVDEIHLLNDLSRGPTLEVTITRLRDIIGRKNNFQILGLSATISNAEELSKWLCADLVKSSYRPIPLKKGVYFDGAIEYRNENEAVSVGSFFEDLVEHSLKGEKQVLVFVNSRKSAESQAEKTGPIAAKYTDKKAAETMASFALSALTRPTKQCRRLSACFLNGCAFHHAGLVAKQRKLIEDSFKSKDLKVIFATPTLAMGVNLPSSVVVIKDIVRYVGGYGMRPIPVLEYEQMAGRAGRPKYDTEGTAIAVARTENDVERIFENYINAETENIFSKLALEPVLRMHILSLVATGHVYSEDQLWAFMEKTFYAHQYNDLTELRAKMKRMIHLLCDYGLIEIEDLPKENSFFVTANNYNKSAKLKATLLGVRVAELYLDPETANLFVESLKNTASKEKNEFSFLHMIVNARELYPQLRVLRKDEDRLNEKAELFDGSIIVPENNTYYDSHLNSIKTALMFYSWISEKGEDVILEEYSVAPGELRAKLETADWLLYSVLEIARLLGISGIQKDISDLRMRVKHGVRRELLPLVVLKGIGRIRARKLFLSGIRNANDIREVDVCALEKIVGKKTALGLKNSCI